MGRLWRAAGLALAVVGTLVAAGCGGGMATATGDAGGHGGGAGDRSTGGLRVERARTAAPVA